MFKRKTFSRGSSRKLETRRHAARAFKRVTRQWQLSFNIKCQIERADPGADCPNGTKIILMSNQELQGNIAGLNSNFPDAVRIKRLEGNLYFRPSWIPAADTGTQSCYTNVFENNLATYMRMGLRKLSGVQSQAGIPDALNPLNNGADPYHISDYADGRWMKLWEHVFDPQLDIGGSAENGFNCCSVQAGYVVPGWTTATGTGTWPGVAVPPIVCEPCGDPETPAVNLGCQFTVKTPRFWHCRVSYGRPIVMKEGDDLSLYIGWERLEDYGNTGRRTQTPLEFFGGMRLLLES